MATLLIFQPLGTGGRPTAILLGAGRALQAILPVDPNASLPTEIVHVLQRLAKREER